MKVRWTPKRMYIVLWLVMISIAAIGIHNHIRTMVNGKDSAGMEAERQFVLGSLEFFYPVMEYSQQEGGEHFKQKFLETACYGLFPLAEYIGIEGERNLYATQMENQLSQEEIEEILAREAADENHVNAEGEVIQSEGAAEESETMIADQVLKQFAEEGKAAPAGSNHVMGEPIENQTVTGQEYNIEMLDYDFLINHFYIVDSTTNITSDKLNAAKLLEKDMTLKQDNSKPQILIYHTHSQEEFADSVQGDSSTTIVGVGNYLTKLLQEKGYHVIHDTTEFDLVDGKLDRNKAYSMALPKIEKTLKENPSIEVVIDLHRDGIDGQKMVTDINGKPTAKLMFFNGLSYSNKNGPITYLENPYIEDNLAFSLKLQLEAAKYYPGATRKIYLKGYRYNLHVRPKSLLVESGAQNNTVQEEMNAMEVLADVLDKVLSPK